jgi:hypothetical protein
MCAQGPAWLMRVREPCLLAASAFSACTVTAAADRQATVVMTALRDLMTGLLVDFFFTG